ncbi:hypothetical protein HDU78_007582 [Chytriomyces hyalinus]|nr:hypothetical protein HDU78_007582 [Chytriomyces hyalinus]
MLDSFKLNTDTPCQITAQMIQIMTQATSNSNFENEYSTCKGLTTESVKVIAAAPMDFISPTSVKITTPKKLTRVIVRENEYSLYSHVPRVLTHALAIAAHFKPPTITGPKPCFFPSPDLEISCPSKFYEISAAPKQVTPEKAAHKKPKKMSRGQKLAAASKLAKAASVVKPKRN